jgi:hypothetical protein
VFVFTVRRLTFNISARSQSKAALAAGRIGLCIASAGGIYSRLLITERDASLRSPTGRWTSLVWAKGAYPYCVHPNADSPSANAPRLLGYWYAQCVPRAFARMVRVAIGLILLNVRDGFHDFGAVECINSRCGTRWSIADKGLHLLLPGGMFSAIPREILQLGPWRKLPGGEILRLKPQDRLTIARDGYALIRTSPAKFDRSCPARRQLAAECACLRPESRSPTPLRRGASLLRHPR